MKPSESSDITEFTSSLGRLSWIGLLAIMAFASTIGLWSVASNISGAVVASGQFVVDGNVKKVQHATGGVVGLLKVREGDHVTQNDVLIRLDDTVTRANLQVVVKQLDEFAVRRARLEAERDRRDEIIVPAQFGDRLADPAIDDLVRSEESLFIARRIARNVQQSQLRKRIAQLNEEIAGLRSQQLSRDRQAVLISGELDSVLDLFKKNLVPLTRKNALEREVANLDGQKGQLMASVAQAEGKIAETELQIHQIDDQLREEVIKELREIQGKTAELIERRIAAEDQLNRVEIRAPSTGFVHQLAVHTVGGVITPAEPVMLIVPEQDSLQVEAHVAPHDIDQVTVGRAVQIRVAAFNQRTTPELNGKVSRVSANTTVDEQTGTTYYTIRVSIAPLELKRLGSEHEISAGMQANVFVKTEDRTPLQFIVKPLHDQIAKAFRER